MNDPPAFPALPVPLPQSLAGLPHLERAAFPRVVEDQPSHWPARLDSHRIENKVGVKDQGCRICEGTPTKFNIHHLSQMVVSAHPAYA